MSASKQKGTAFESSLLPLFGVYYPGAMRNPQFGAADRGDFHLPGAHFAVEAKNCKRLELAQWAGEGAVEAGNLGVPYWVIAHKRKGQTAPGFQWVTTTLWQFLEMVKRD